jgi:hypothetical protein
LLISSGCFFFIFTRFYPSKKELSSESLSFLSELKLALNNNKQINNSFVQEINYSESSQVSSAIDSTSFFYISLGIVLTVAVVFLFVYFSRGVGEPSSPPSIPGIVSKPNIPDIVSGLDSKLQDIQAGVVLNKEGLAHILNDQQSRLWERDSLVEAFLKDMDQKHFEEIYGTHQTYTHTFAAKLESLEASVDASKQSVVDFVKEVDLVYQGVGVAAVGILKETFKDRRKIHKETIRAIEEESLVMPNIEKLESAISINAEEINQAMGKFTLAIERNKAVMEKNSQLMNGIDSHLKNLKKPFNLSDNTSIVSQNPGGELSVTEIIEELIGSI